MLAILIAVLVVLLVLVVVWARERFHTPMASGQLNMNRPAGKSRQTRFVRFAGSHSHPPRVSVQAVPFYGPPDATHTTHQATRDGLYITTTWTGSASPSVTVYWQLD